MPKFSFQANSAWDLTSHCSGTKQATVKAATLVFPSGQTMDVTQYARQAFKHKLAFNPSTDGLLFENKLKVPFHEQGRLPQAPVFLTLEVECTSGAQQQGFTPPGEEGAVFVQPSTSKVTLSIKPSETPFILVVVGFLIAGIGGVFYSVQNMPYVFMTGMFLLIIGVVVFIVGLWAVMSQI